MNVTVGLVPCQAVIVWVSLLGQASDPNSRFEGDIGILVI